MEPRGCNWWQSVANRPALEPRKQAKSVAAGYHRLPREVHGKEGVYRRSQGHRRVGPPPLDGVKLAEVDRFALWSGVSLLSLIDLFVLKSGRIG
jgi:hypothetical protein